MDTKKMIKEIENRREQMLKNYEILSNHDKNDKFWQIIPERAKDGYVFELGMVINWIGFKYKPKKILEIGTRTGGSLIHLLSSYDIYNDLEIYCFDYWQYPPDESAIPCIYRFVPSSIKKMIFKKYYMKKIEKNLNLFKIPIKNIYFISGDSKSTVPNFFKNNPKKQFDYILVDGGHDKLTASTDLENVVGHVASGGVILFDDLERENLLNVWNQFKEKHSDEFYFYDKIHRKGIGWGFKK
jgi:predicted O-methyltransferase YrrM